MRIALVNGRADVIAGIAHHMEDLAIGLRDRGHDPWIVTGEGIWTDRLRQRRIGVHVIPELQREISPRTDALAAAKLLRHLRARRPDVLAAHGAKAGALGRTVGLVTRTPVTYTPHAWAFEGGAAGEAAGTYLRMERMLARLPGDIIAVSDHEARVGIDAQVGDAAAYTTIHNGIPDVEASLRARPGDAPPHLVMAARFEPQKDHETLLRALATLSHLDWTASLAGSGPGQPAMEALAVELGLASRVRFLGHHHDVPGLLAGAQVYVMLSHWESFPLSILEAMRAGLPCVVSDVGGNAEAVEEGVNGLLVPPGDVAAAAAALGGLIADPDQRQRMGGQARARFTADFGQQPMLERTEAVYRRACGLVA